MCMFTFFSSSLPFGFVNKLNDTIHAQKQLNTSSLEAQNRGLLPVNVFFFLILFLFLSQKSNLTVTQFSSPRLDDLSGG